MRKAIFILPLLAILVANLDGQSPKRKRQTRKVDPSWKTESPCGVSQSLDEFIEEKNVEWRQAAEDKEATYYYNTQKKVCENKILKVWVKAVQKDDKSFDHSMSRYELDCHHNKLRLMSLILYRKDGNVVIDPTAHGNPKWDDVIPDTVGENIWQTVCYQKAAKTKGIDLSTWIRETLNHGIESGL